MSPPPSTPRPPASAGASSATPHVPATPVESAGWSPRSHHPAAAPRSPRSPRVAVARGDQTLPAGTPVVVVRRPEQWLRGRAGRVHSFDASSGRYLLLLPPQPGEQSKTPSEPLAMLALPEHLEVSEEVLSSVQKKPKFGPTNGGDAPQHLAATTPQQPPSRGCAWGVGGAGGGVHPQGGAADGREYGRGIDSSPGSGGSRYTLGSPRQPNDGTIPAAGVLFQPLDASPWVQQSMHGAMHARRLGRDVPTRQVAAAAVPPPSTWSFANAAAPPLEPSAGERPASARPAPARRLVASPPPAGLGPGARPRMLSEHELRSACRGQLRLQETELVSAESVAQISSGQISGGQISGGHPEWFGGAAASPASREISRARTPFVESTAASPQPRSRERSPVRQAGRRGKPSPSWRSRVTGVAQLISRSREVLHPPPAAHIAVLASPSPSPRSSTATSPPPSTARASPRLTPRQAPRQTPRHTPQRVGEGPRPSAAASSVPPSPRHVHSPGAQTYATPHGTPVCSARPSSAAAKSAVPPDTAASGGRAITLYGHSPRPTFVLNLLSAEGEVR